MKRTRGGRGTNQYQVKGRSVAETRNTVSEIAGRVAAEKKLAEGRAVYMRRLESARVAAEKEAATLRRALRRAEPEGTCRRCGNGSGQKHWTGAYGADLGACHRCGGTGSARERIRRDLEDAEVRARQLADPDLDEPVHPAVAALRWYTWQQVWQHEHRERARQAGISFHETSLSLVRYEPPAEDSLLGRLMAAVKRGEQIGPVKAETLVALREPDVG